jgi:Transposase DDE domain
VNELDAEALLLGAYVLILLAAAAVLDFLARRSHERSQRSRTAGFRYHEHLDAWECPEGQHLWPHEHDRDRGLARYRGKPRICNACPRKPDCTDSDDGREIVRFLDDWPRLEVGRFHRGLSLTLIVLAGAMAVTALVRHHAPAELAGLGGLLVLSGYLGLRLTPGRVPALASRATRRSSPPHASG